MKQKSLTNKRKTGKGRIAAVLALAVLLGAAPAVKTEAVDLDSGSITINKPAARAEDKAFEELQDIDVAVDYYLVAKAQLQTGYDAYDFVWAEDSPFSEQKDTWTTITSDDNVTGDEVSTFTQELAGVVLENVPAYLSGKEEGTHVQATATGTLGEKLNISETTPAGLYLVIARDINRKDYRGVPAEGEEDQLFTIAESPSKLYEFLPMLVSVPTRNEPVDGGMVSILGENYPIMIGNTAADAGDWLNDIEMVAKVGEKPRVGKLTITKNLPTYKTKEGKVIPATFVFSIKAVNNGQTVYSNVESLVFDGTKQNDKILIEDLPIGSIVTVSEMYTGDRNYKVQSEDTQEVTIVSEENSAEFTNEPGDSSHGGGSVKNSFSINDKIQWETNQEFNNETGSASTKTE